MRRLAFWSSLIALLFTAAALPACAQQDSLDSVMADCGGAIPPRLVDSCLERVRVLDETNPSPQLQSLEAQLSRRTDRIRTDEGAPQAYGNAGPDNQAPPPGYGSNDQAPPPQGGDLGAPPQGFDQDHGASPDDQRPPDENTGPDDQPPPDESTGPGDDGGPPDMSNGPTSDGPPADNPPPPDDSSPQ